MKHPFFQKAVPHALAIIVFVFIALIYCYPVFEGKQLNQHDVKQAKGMAKENREIHQETGKLPLWSNSMFGGMPAYLIYMDYPYSVPTHIGRGIAYLLPEPANIIFLYMLGCYLGMIILGFRPSIAAFGAISFAFASYNIINLGAGHVSKTISIALAPPFLASVILTYRGKLWLGGVLTAFFAALHQYGNFIQITYYIALSMVLYALFEFFIALKNKTVKRFLVSSVVVFAAVLLSLGTHAARHWVVYEYSQYSIRGQSDLSAQPENVVQSELKKEDKDLNGKGLDKEYAFRWSYGLGESFNLIVPNLYGGASGGQLDASSNTYQVLTKNGVPAPAALGFVQQSVPLYWGDQPITGGPAYVGVVVFFLFVFCFVLLKNKLKWWGLAVITFFMMLAWGKNFSTFNDLMFDYFPLYNKFRAVTMVLSIVSLYMLIIVGAGLRELLKKHDNKADEQLRKSQIKKLKYTVLGVGGVLLLLAVAGRFFFTFESSNDAQFLAYLTQATQNNDVLAKGIMGAIVSDRVDLMQADSWRSLFFVLIATVWIWVFLSGKIKGIYFILGLSILSLIDLWIIDKRYLNANQFVKKSTVEKFIPSPADAAILKDTTNYRVLNTTVSTFNDATTSYFHHSIGGYHGAKIRRYQDLISTYLGGFNPGILNMLNTKYLIVRGENNPKAERNEAALGNAWLVKHITMVDNADEELRAIGDFNPENTAVVDKRFQDQIRQLDFKTDSSAYIKLTSYHPDKMIYEYHSKFQQAAVFSEMYYEKGWEVMIDDQAADYFRVNYILRGMLLPKGKHTITFVFRPGSYYKGQVISLISSIILIIIMACAIFYEVKRRRST